MNCAPTRSASRRARRSASTVAAATFAAAAAAVFAAAARRSLRARHRALSFFSINFQVDDPARCATLARPPIGPALARLLPTTLDQVTFLALDQPGLVDWVGYKARVRAASADDVAEDVVRWADNRRILLVYCNKDKSLGVVCHALVAQRRPHVLAEATGADESSSVVVFEAEAA